MAIYLKPSAESLSVVNRRKEMVRGLLDRFLPINLRVVFVLEPVVYDEWVYDYGRPEHSSPRLITDGTFCKYFARDAESVPSVTETSSATVPQWTWIRAWQPGQSGHLSVDTSSLPPELGYRTWHIAVLPGGQ